MRNQPECDKIAPSSRKTTSVLQSVCPECGFENRYGTYFCIDCGANLLFEQPVGMMSVSAKSAEVETVPASTPSATIPRSMTRRLQQPLRLTTKELGQIMPDQSFVFSDHAIMRLIPRGEGQNISIRLMEGEAVVLGRRDVISLEQPGLDLNEYQAESFGVSRLHATIKVKDHRLILQDIGSTNGTFVNGLRFEFKEQCQLRSGDEIALGRLKFLVYFYQDAVTRTGGFSDAVSRAM